MIGKRTLQATLAGAVLAGGSLMALPGLASASLRPHSFASEQAQLETQLANRLTQLGRLGTDVTGAKATLTPAHFYTLNLSIMTATNNINALVPLVKTAPNVATLNTDRASMLKQNRVYAVLTPQVFETIEADAIAAQVLTFQADEPTLQTSVNNLAGPPVQNGYNNALNHFEGFVKSVNGANKDAANVVTKVLAQTPADYQGDTHVFVHTNEELFDADIALAHATYDESVIGLASGGYTGP